MPSSLHNQVAASFKRWATGVDLCHTRAGARYRGQDVAFLLRRPLAEDGFTVAMGRDSLVFVRAGEYMPRAKVREYLVEALAGIDETLTASLGGKSTLDEILGLLPERGGPYEKPKAHPARRAPAPVTAEAREFVLQAMADMFSLDDYGEQRSEGKTDEIYEIYTEFADADGVRPLGRNTFFRVADESPIASRKRRNTGAYYVLNA